MNTRAVDFLRTPRPPRIGWVLLAVGGLTLVGALWCEKQWASERSAALRAEQEAIAAQRVLQTPAPLAEPSLAQRRWQQAQAELHRPWLPALRVIESAAVNPVFLLSMTIEPAKGTIKLDAEAPSFGHALAFVQVLDEGNVLLPAMLVSHEQAADPATGGSLVRFSAITQWVAR